MFDDLKDAWSEAVGNFRRELRDSPGAGGTEQRIAARRGEVAAARRALGRLDEQIGRARDRLESERQEERNCRRRAKMAKRIDDGETARIAARYAERHARFRDVLERKIEVLEDERALRGEILREMEHALRTSERRASGPRPDAARRRSTDERLEELKRRMQ